MTDSLEPRILVYGAGSYARLLAEIVLENGLGLVDCFFSPDAKFHPGLSKYGAKPVNSMPDLMRLLPACSHFVVAIGNDYGFPRWQISIALEKLGLKPLRIIHPSSSIAPTVMIGRGCVVMARATIQHFTTIGDYCIINTNSTIDHEGNLGMGVHIMGGCSVAGRVEVGDFATLGTNATVLPDAQVGKNAYVGAGAVVLRKVLDNEVVAGVPAKRIGERKLMMTSDPIGACR